MKNILEINNITKKINNKPILNSVNLSLGEGDIVALIGPNGAGKTTLLKTITGLSKLTKGSISINGFNLISDFKQAISKVGALIEEPEFYNNLTGNQNLKLFSKMNDEKITNNQVLNYAKSLGIYTAIYKKVSSYSLGMRQRLGICETLLGSPNLLLLDEPLNGLDPNGVIQIKKTIQQLSKQGVTVLISSHQLSELETMCNKYIMIDKGTITAQGEIHPEHNSDIEAEYPFVISTTDNKKALKLLNDKNVTSENGFLFVQMNVKEMNHFILKCNNAEVFIIEIKRREENLENLFKKTAIGGE